MAERSAELWNEPALKKYGDSTVLKANQQSCACTTGIGNRTSAGFEGVSAKGKDVGGEARL